MKSPVIKMERKECVRYQTLVDKVLEKNLQNLVMLRYYGVIYLTTISCHILLAHLWY
jgi:hypothetical protein